VAWESLSGSLEDNILTLQVWSDEHAADIALKVPVELYSTRAYQRIAGLAVDYIARYQRPPRAHLRDLLESELRGEEGRFLTSVLDSMDRLHEEMQPEFVLPELDRFIDVRRLTITVTRAADSLHAGDLEAAREALGEVQYRAEESPGVFLHDTDRWLRFLDADENGEAFSSGIDILDERKVSPRRRSLFLVIAAAGEGKSYWLRQIGKHNVLVHRKKVLHITLENDLDETLQFYTMAFLGKSSDEVAHLRVPILKKDALGRFATLDYAEVVPDQITPAKKRSIARELKRVQTRGQLMVKWFPTGVLTVAQLSTYLDSLARDGFRPDMVILDYADLMYTDERNLRISTGRVYRDLRGLAGIRDLAMVTATQGNRLSAGARLVTSGHAAEDWSKIGTADTVCTLSRTLDEKEIGLARILVAKSRRSRDKWIALITQSYATGQFALDSVYFNKVAQSELARVTGNEREEDGG
jgi:hypothetical protein